jgi:YD repeat-containing protein
VVSEAESKTDPTGTYQFTAACPERSRRNNMGRLTGTSTQYAFLTSRTFTTSYDAASNRTSFTDPENGSSGYIYDTLNRLQTLTPPTAYGTGSFGLGYDALSRRTSLTRPNTVNTSYGYDNLSRLLSVTHAKGGEILSSACHPCRGILARSRRRSLGSKNENNQRIPGLRKTRGH